MAGPSEEHRGRWVDGLTNAEPVLPGGVETREGPTAGTAVAHSAHHLPGSGDT